jgi:hypothetical protein
MSATSVCSSLLACIFTLLGVPQMDLEEKFQPELVWKKAETASPQLLIIIWQIKAGLVKRFLRLSAGTLIKQRDIALKNICYR